jgi:hypothetical protein
VDSPARAPRPSRVLLAAAATVLAGVVTAGCDNGVPEPPSAAVVTAVGLRLQRTDLTGPELTRAKSLAEQYVASLVAAHAELTGLTVQGIFPVFDETSPAPVGAMARLVLPATVPSVELDLIRSRNEVPELVPSHITQLRSLDAIFEFGRGRVLFVGLSPLGSDAASPGTIAQARPVDPEAHRDAGFGEDE